MDTSLPIWEIAPQILSALDTRNRLVLVAPTGSGKTTQVPQLIWDAAAHTASPYGPDRRIVVLQPRRVAARTVAARVAFERNTRLGDLVGYQIRFEDHTSLGTILSFITEGILLRWLQDNRTLEGIGAILFDEFHERNLLSDAALALVKHLQAAARPDLKLIVMSATLDAEPVARYLGDCPILVSEGQSFPVETRYLKHREERPASEQAADTVESIIRSGAPGDILVFMPGMSEINATINACKAMRVDEPVALIPLHGDLPPEDQDRAFAENPRRKIIVSTNVAETSVTIPGIRHVVDAGLARISRFDAERGLNTLFLEEISRASADQRKGRAGRTAPGVCHRLWTESNHLNRPAKNTPEIQRADLAEIVLLLHSLGIRQAASFDWLDKPDPQAVDRAEKLLRFLGAIQPVSNPAQRSDLTPAGRQMLRLPMHPRYSRMLVEAARNRCVPEAALCAALVSGRDLLVRLSREDKHIAEARELFEASADSDFYTLMRAFQFARKNSFSVDACRRYGIHAQTARQVHQTFEQILEAAKSLRSPAAPAPSADKSDPVPAAESAPAEEGLLKAIMSGFIDQLCVRRNQGTLECDLTEGRSGTLQRESVVQNSRLFVAANIREVSGRTGHLTLLGLASAVKREWLDEMFPQHLSVRSDAIFDRGHKRVASLRITRFLDLPIQAETDPNPDQAASGLALAKAFLNGWIELPNYNHEIKQFIARVNLVQAAMPELEIPPLHADAIQACLAKAFHGLTLAKEAQALNLREAFQSHLPKDQRSWIDELAPGAIPWLDEKNLKLLYPEAPEKEQPALPEAQVKITDCFKLSAHPRICEGRVPVKLWLAGPDGKRIESTTDWPAFKTNQYPKLRPNLLKKYPGVPWIG